MLTDDLDFSGFSADTVEAVAEAGGLIPPGKYHVALKGAADRHSQRTGNTGTELEYEILTGPFAGKTVKDTVWTPDAGDTGPSANRFVLVAHRLGVLAINPKTKKYEKVAGKASFGDVLGAEVVIEVNHRSYKRDDGSEGKATNVTFDGVWSVNDAKVKDVPKAKSGGQPASGSAAAPAKPKTPVTDL